MIISDLNYREVIFEETSIVGGATFAFAQARAIAKGTNNAYALTSTSTQAVSYPGYDLAVTESTSEAYAN